MECNNLEMRAVASQIPGNFTKEGLLFIKEKGDKKGKKQRAFKEHWFKLKGNILFYMKGRERVSEPRGLIVLERCTVELDSNETMDYYCFLIVFEGGEPIQLAAATEQERDEWVHSLHTASYECMKMQLQSLREALQGRTGSGDILGATGAADEDDDTSEPWIEICISCDHLPLRADGLPPNPMAEVLCIALPQVTWTKVGQTEVAEQTCNPCFLKTVSLAESRAQAKTVIKIVLYDVVERITDTRTCMGQVICTSNDLASGGEEHRVRQKISTPMFTEGGYMTLLAWADPHCNATDSPRSSMQGQGRRLPGVLPSRSESVRSERLRKRDQLKPLFANVVCKSFRFPSIKDGEELDVSEFLGESKLTFVLAVEWLKFMLQDSKEWSEQLCQLGMLTGDWERWRLLALEKSRAQQAFYVKSIKALDEGYLSKGCTFKPSQNKGVKGIEVVPLNLHLHRMLVKNCSTEKAGTEENSGSFYDIVTVGAFAAHTLKFKDGGLFRQLMQRSSTSTSASSHSAADSVPQNGALGSPQSVDAEHATATAAHCHRLSAALTHLRVPNAVPLVRAQRVALSRCLESCAMLRRISLAAADMASVGRLNATGPSYSDAIVQLKNGCNEILEIADQPLVGEGLETLKMKIGEVRTAELSPSILADCLDSMPKLLVLIQAQCEQLLQSPADTGQPGGDCSDSREQHHSMAYCTATLMCNLNTLESLVRSACQNIMAALTFIMLYDLKDTATFGDEELALRHDIVVCQAVVAATTGVLAKVRARITDGDMLRRVALAGMLLEFESLLSCHREEAGMLEDFAIGVRELGSVKYRFTENPSAVDDYGIYWPQLSGSRHEMVISLPLPSAVYRVLPEELQNSRLFGIVPVLFNIGINEIATLAERFGDVRLQEEINRTSFERLRKYCELCQEILHIDHVNEGIDVMHDAVKQEMSVFGYSDSMNELLSRLHQHVTIQKNKNVEVLHLAAEITRRMDGIRFTSCKSAKDRTAMAITLEEVQILQNRESLAPHVFLRALECLRSEGVRRLNTFKNCGSLKYAFNSLQLQSFPKLYRPPHGTYGGGES